MAVSAGSPAIQVRDLRKRYGGREVVDGVSFDVAGGEVFALLGPNGAGKTTTVEILEGYRRPDGGEARVLGLDPRRDASRLRPMTGLMLQQGGVYPLITPREALRLFASLYPRPLDPDALLERLGLAEVAATRFRYLSGGQKQRLSLGLALIGRPRLVFLDEPTAGMDPEARRATWEVIQGLKADGVTVLLTTHALDEAERLADHVAILDRGRLVALGTPDTLRQHAARGFRLRTSPALAPAEVAGALDLPPGAVRLDGAYLLVDVEATPPLLARLALTLEARGALITGLEVGSGSLEAAYLALTAERRQP